MQLFTGILVYVLCWWVIWFMTLPFGVRTQEEEGEIEPGTVHSAPAKPKLLIKAGVTTVIAGIVWGVIYYLIITAQA